MGNLIHDIGRVIFPPFSGVRVMMMPFCPHAPRSSIPSDLYGWLPAIDMVSQYVGPGTAYLTIDEALVPAGETHRRPGVHIDGSASGGWGGGGSWGGGCADRWGWATASSHRGCRAWDQALHGIVGEDGDCSALAGQLRPGTRIDLAPRTLYLCSPILPHESVPMAEDTQRQFFRISFPSSAPWFKGYTPSPFGILPDGPILPRRAAQMGFRP